MPEKSRRAIPWQATAAVTALVALATLWWMPASTRQGVNFQVRTVQIPLAVKGMDFLVRDWKYRAAAAEITAGQRSPDEKILAIYAWTREHIRRQPQEWPVIDDHILHIMIRGYGISDQMADVFTTLCAYAGVPAYWRLVRVSPNKGALVLSFARAERGWITLDLSNGVIFRDAAGALVPSAALPASPELVSRVVGDRTVDGVPYADYLNAIGDVTPPSPMRSELQMPGRRLVYELRRLVGFGRVPG